MDAAAANTRASELRRAIATHKRGVALHRREYRKEKAAMKRSMAKLQELEQVCARFGIALTYHNDHAAPKGEQGGDSNSSS